MNYYIALKMNIEQVKSGLVTEGEYKLYRNKANEYKRKQNEKKNLINPSRHIIIRNFLLNNSDFILNGYSNGDSLASMREKLMKNFNIDIPISSIKKFLEKNNIKIKEFWHYRRKYTCNESYFDSIDTPEKAYICGWIWTDGCNFKEYNNLILHLQERDKPILDFINQKLENTRPLAYIGKMKQTNPSWRLVCRSERICDRLTELGCIPRKSLVLKFPTFLDDSLLRYFILGAFEGDGCLYISEKYRSHRFGLTGTKDFLFGIGEILKNKLGINYSLKIEKRCKSQKVYNLYFFGRQTCIKIRDYLYKDISFPILQRKYDKFLSL